MNSAGQLNTSSANTAFMAMGSEVFARAENLAWQTYVKSVPCDGANLEIDAIGPSPEVREMTSIQRFGAYREYARRVAVKPYSADAVEFARARVDGDKSGLIELALKDYLDSVKSFFWKPVVDLLNSNPTCIDGGALLSTTHSYASGGGTWSNKVTTAFTPAAMATGVQAMVALLLENGAPASIRPTHLYVNPNLERDAKDAIGVQRPMPVDNTGVVNATSGVVAAVLGQNWLAGELQLIVEPRSSTTTDWLLIDCSKPNAKPIIAGMQGAPEPIINGPGTNSQTYFDRDVYQYTVRARAALSGFMPHVIYGRLG